MSQFPDFPPDDSARRPSETEQVREALMLALDTGMPAIQQTPALQRTQEGPSGVACAGSLIFFIILAVTVVVAVILLVKIFSLPYF